MKTQHRIYIRTQIGIRDGMVVFIAKANTARLGVAADTKLTPDEFCDRFCEHWPGKRILLRKSSAGWVITKTGKKPGDMAATVSSVWLQRLNEMSEADRAKEDVGLSPTYNRDDNPFLFVLELDPVN